MTAIFIRLKNLLAFGLIILCFSFLWLGIKVINTDQKVYPTGAEVDQVEIMTPNQAEWSFEEPTVTIIPEEVTEETEDKDHFFSEYRMERDRKRGEQIELLREIVNNPNSISAARQEAQQKLLKISDCLEKESKVENALVAKGFKDAVAVIQIDTVMIIVPSSGLRQDEIARIADMVVKVVGCKMEDVVIVPKTL